MSNRLKMANVHAIIGLLEQKWSYRRIARELHVDRGTVARYDRLRSNAAIPSPGSGESSDSNPAISTAGSGESSDPNAAIPTAGSLLEELAVMQVSGGWPPGRASQCDPFKNAITKKLDAGLSAQRIWQDLVEETGFTGSYSSVKRFVRRLGAATPVPFRRMECEPGEEAQVDFGSGAWVIEDGKRRRPHVIRVTLSHSRKSHSEPVWRQTTEGFIRRGGRGPIAERPSCGNWHP